jgi:hypothetical protein
MSEPKLSDIEDYDTLKGEKKKVVWGVILIGILIGAVYVVSYNIFDNKEDTIITKDIIQVVPPAKNIFAK